MSSNETKSTSCAASYICGLCEGEFHREDDWTDEDARQEFHEKYGRDPGPDDVIVCDNCSKKIDLFFIINGEPQEDE